MDKRWINQCTLCLVDIGASGGIHPRWDKISSHLKPILFEPDAREYTRLQANSPKGFEILNTALSDHAGELQLHLCQKQTNSSVYQPNFELLEKFPDCERFKVERQIQVPCDTLDHQLENHGLTDIDFIKADAQGHELPILQGASRTLNQVIGLEVEVEFCEIYKNQPLFADVDSFVRKNNFLLFDLKRYYWKKIENNTAFTRKGQLIFADALYFRDPEDILSWSGLNASKVARAMMVYLAYGYYNLAEFLFHTAQQKGIVAGEAEQDLRFMLNNSTTHFVLGNFRGKLLAYRAFSKFAQLFSSKTWYAVDIDLGNS